MVHGITLRVPISRTAFLNTLPPAGCMPFSTPTTYLLAYRFTPRRLVDSPLQAFLFSSWCLRFAKPSGLCIFLSVACTTSSSQPRAVVRSGLLHCHTCPHRMPEGTLTSTALILLHSRKRANMPLPAGNTYRLHRRTRGAVTYHCTRCKFRLPHYRQFHRGYTTPPLPAATNSFLHTTATRLTTTARQHPTTGRLCCSSGFTRLTAARLPSRATLFSHSRVAYPPTPDILVWLRHVAAAPRPLTLR